MELLLKIVAFLIAYIGMEAVAWLAHKYLMHGVLWFLHNDHHKQDPNSFLEKNDWFFVLFATPGIVLILLGIEAQWDYKFFLGIGIAAYGFTYFVVHEIFIHQRLPFLRRTNSVFWGGIRRAHRKHHLQKLKENGECFGMLYVPKTFFKQEREHLQRQKKLKRK